MTKKQFKDAMLKGQGRCLIAVRENPDKYYSIVLWACSHEIAFDTQCEGSRSWFVYQLIECYDDTEPFFNTAVKSLKKTKPKAYSWKILYLSELIRNFDTESAMEALWSKYNELYSALISKKSLPEFGFLPARKDFEHICLVLADDRKAMAKIAHDIGRLYSEKPFYCSYVFDWLYATQAEPRLKWLKRLAKKDKNIEEYLRVESDAENRRKENLKNRDSQMPDKGLALSYRLTHESDAEEISRYAEEYLHETDKKKRAEALTAFAACPFPGDPTPVIKDAGSDDEQLRTAAWNALEEIRHPYVREFALANLENEPERALILLIVNYDERKDKELLISLVKSIPVYHDDKLGEPHPIYWHTIFGQILEMPFYGLKAPKELLYYIYENNYCSFCRESAIFQLGRRRLLTKEILNECLYDSNEDIRTYAEKRLKAMNK